MICAITVVTRVPFRQLASSGRPDRLSKSLHCGSEQPEEGNTRPSGAAQGTLELGPGTKKACDPCFAIKAWRH